MYLESEAGVHYLCEAYTTGGPVAILQQQYLSLWDGDKDYFRALKQSRTGSLQLVRDFKEVCPLCLFHQESDGNFHVYHDPTNIVVLSEISADQGYEINRSLPPITQAIAGRPPVMLREYGGTVVVFDAAIPGHIIDLVEPGCAQAEYGPKLVAHRYDVAVIEVDIGDWQASELFLKTDHLAFSGVWIRRTGRSRARVSGPREEEGTQLESP